MKRFLKVLFITSYIGVNANAICMNEFDAFNLDCEMSNDVDQNTICTEENGENFYDYIESETCNLKSQEYLNGNLYGSKEENIEVSDEKISCFTYSVGRKFGCNQINNVDAEIFCRNKYSLKYLPFHSSRECTMEKADEAFGYVSKEDAIGDLESQIAETKAIMFMIDRSDIRAGLEGLISLKPIIGNDFYSPIMKGLLSKMTLIKAQLKKASTLKIRFEVLDKLVKLTQSYLALVSRIYKVYAFVAHKNDKELSSYSFENLDFLNLELSKDLGLLLFQKQMLNIKNIGDGFVEISQLEQNKQVYEYLALSEPKTKQDYAKLIAFSGLRENLTNYWALDKYSQKDMLKRRFYNYGRFLSFRKARFGEIKDLPTIKENINYDLLQTEFFPRLENLRIASTELSLFNGAEAYQFLDIFVNKVQKQKLINTFLKHDHINEIMNIFNLDETNVWNNYSQNHFYSFVFPGDDFQNKEEIINILAEETYKIKLKTAQQTLFGLIVENDEETIDAVSKIFIRELNNTIKYIYISKLKSKFRSILSDYNDRKNRVTEHTNKSIEKAVEQIRQNAKNSKKYVMLQNLYDKRKIKVQPQSFEDLMYLFEFSISRNFQDIKKAIALNDNYAGIINNFFDEVKESFYSKFSSGKALNSDDYKLNIAGSELDLGGVVTTFFPNVDRDNYYGKTEKERSRALLSSLMEVAKRYYDRNKFEITNLATIPEAVKLAREEEQKELIRDVYKVEVYKDGTPVVMSLEDIYKAFEVDLGIEITNNESYDYQRRIFGMQKIYDYKNRDIKDRLTDGTFDRPISYIFSDGSLYFENVDADIDEYLVKKLYLNSIHFTKKEISENNKNRLKALEAKNNVYASGLIDDIPVLGTISKSVDETLFGGIPDIVSSQHLFARLFSLFNIPLKSIREDKSVYGFQLNYDQKIALLENSISKTYTENPILRLELPSTEFKEEYYRAPDIKDSHLDRVISVKKNISRSVLLKTSYEAYDLDSNTFDKEIARKNLKKVILRAKTDIKNTIGQFVNLNYNKIKDNKKLRLAFKSAASIRARLKRPIGTTIENAKRISKLDEEIKLDVRTASRAFNEDYLEPITLYAGLLSIVCVGIILSIGSLGTAVPAIFAVFASVEFYVSLVLMTATISIRMNTGLIEVPSQIAFQKSVANSQIVSDKLISYDIIKQNEDENSTYNKTTGFFAVMTAMYGGMVVKQLSTNIGNKAVKSFERMTNLKVSNYSLSTRASNKTTKDYVEKYGLIKGVSLKTKLSVSRIRSMLPKYHNLSDEMLGMNLLRTGLVNAMKKMNLQKNPWLLTKEIEKYSNRVNEKLSKFNKFNRSESQVIERITKRGIVEPEDVIALKSHHNNYSYFMKSFWDAIKNKRTLNYITKYGDVRAELRYLKSQLLQKKVIKLETMIEKLNTLKVNNAGVRGDSKILQDMIDSFDDSEIMLLKEVTSKLKNRFKSQLTEIRKTFGHYEAIMDQTTFKPVAYLNAKENELFRTPLYQTNTLLPENGPKTLFKSDTEDIVNFYESLIQQHGFRDKSTNDLRLKVEDYIQSLYTEKDGIRHYL